MSVVYALFSYLLIFVALPYLLRNYAPQESVHMFLNSSSIIVAAILIALSAISALFSHTKIRGVFGVALGFVSFAFVSEAFKSVSAVYHISGEYIVVNYAFLVELLKLFCLFEAAIGVTRLVGDNS